MAIKVAMFSSQLYDKQFFAPLLPEHVELTYFEHPLNESTVNTANGFHVVVVFVNDLLSVQVIERLAQLGVKHIALRCAGFNNVELGSAKRHNIRVSRVPEYAPEAVAEHVIALLMTLNRKTHKAYNRVKENNFMLHGLLGFNIRGKTIGIIGTGKIGAACAQIFLGFGASVLCYDPSPNNVLLHTDAKYVDLDSLFREADIVSLHCPLNEHTHHLIDADSIAKMKQGVTLINTSRGGLLDTQAVINALKAKKIANLGLDVYEMESDLFFRDHSLEIVQDDIFQRLLTFPNVLITGHQGFFTQEALTEIAQVTLKNIQELASNSADINSTNFLV